MKRNYPEKKLITKVLKLIQENPYLLSEKDVNYIVGASSTEIINIKKYIINQGLATRIKNFFQLTDAGLEFLKNNPYESWCNKEYPKRPNTNLEYLKAEIQPAILSKAIRRLAEHLLEGKDIKLYSMEHNIYREIFTDPSVFTNIRTDAKKYLEQDRKIKLANFYDKFMNPPYGLTKSLTSILLLYALTKTKNELAIYELFEFQLKLDTNMFFRMLYRPERFETQYTIINDIPIIEGISQIILPYKNRNILGLTKGLIAIIQSLDKYTLNTSRLSPMTIRFRNAIIHAKDPISLFYRDIPNILDNKLLCYCGADFSRKFKLCIDELQYNYISLKEELRMFLFKVFNDTERHSLKKRCEIIEDYLNNKRLKILCRNIKDNTYDDDLWIERIATYINGTKVPKDWTDENVADFKIKLKALADSFLIIESTAGISEIKFNKAMQDVLSQLLKLSKNKQLLIAKKIVNF